MKKYLFVLGLGLVLVSGYGFAQEAAENAAPAAAESDADTMEAVEVGNKNCPITGEELNLADDKAYTSIEVDGAKINVSLKGKELYTASPDQYKDKIAAVIAEAEGMEEGGDEEAPANGEASENAEQK